MDDVAEIGNNLRLFNAKLVNLICIERREREGERARKGEGWKEVVERARAEAGERVNWNEGRRREMLIIRVERRWE